ncbi:putative acyl-coenzyme A thioesterase 6 isoform X1 [Mirounga leonina]|uniref:putative acyl-coenzyme A thioesterase 6 isoform X1 n=1 Tax=Mirounga leonina TaxID=9715 RepID=UPI00156C55F7|nr:putative acyl-coenzyme A thioesterase 6 isoform X1 [Mirounga leonina]
MRRGSRRCRWARRWPPPRCSAGSPALSCAVLGCRPAACAPGRLLAAPGCVRSFPQRALHGFRKSISESRLALLANLSSENRAGALIPLFCRPRHQVKGPNIGVIGSGKGAELAFSMASFLPNIAAVVSISGCISNTTTALTCGRFILPGLPFNLDKISAMDSGVYDVKEALDDPLDPAYRESCIPLEKANAHFLVIVGEDDRHWKSSVHADIAVKHLTEHGKTNFTLLSYPNAGHRIDPPYSPFFSITRSRVGSARFGKWTAQSSCCCSD